MFTLAQINTIHDSLGRADSLVAYLKALRAIGVDTCDSFIADGHSEYKGSGQTVRTPPTHKELTIAETSDAKAMQKHIEQHGKQETSYIQMSQGLAESGVEKWTFDTHALTLTYYDKAGNTLFSEALND